MTLTVGEQLKELSHETEKLLHTEAFGFFALCAALEARNKCKKFPVDLGVKTKSL